MNNDYFKTAVMPSEYPGYVSGSGMTNNYGSNEATAAYNGYNHHHDDNHMHHNNGGYGVFTPHDSNYPKNQYIKEIDYVNSNVSSKYSQMKEPVLNALDPLVDYGNREAKMHGTVHALRETTAISYLMGKGYDLNLAHQIVESWERNEKF